MIFVFNAARPGSNIEIGINLADTFLKHAHSKGGKIFYISVSQKSLWPKIQAYLKYKHFFLGSKTRAVNSNGRKEITR